MCPVGRNRDDNHAVCRSCIRQGVVSCTKPKPAKPGESVRVWHSGRVLSTSAYYESVNCWHGRPRGVYLAERRKWEAVFRGTVFLWGAQGEARRSVAVRRYVASARQIIKDRDNLDGGIKPLKDALVRCGVLRDDRDSDVAYSVVQEVDPANPRVEIEVRDEENHEKI